MRNWRTWHWLTALVVLAGVIAGAWSLTVAAAVIWVAVTYCAEYTRAHAFDDIDPKVTHRFRALARYHLCGSAVLYLVPIGLAIAFYLCLAAFVTFFDNSMTVGQLLALQRWCLRGSTFFDNWIKLSEFRVFFLLVGVYLLNCLLLSWHGNGGASSGRREARAVVRSIRWVAGRYCRFSGPLAAGLAVLASLTLLSVPVSTLGAELRLKAVTDQKAYVAAADKVQAELSGQVASRLYGQVLNAMPPKYQKVLLSLTDIDRKIKSASDRVNAARRYGAINLNGEKFLGEEKGRLRRVEGLQSKWTINDSVQSQNIRAPESLTHEQAVGARKYVAAGPADNDVEILKEDKKAVFLQVEKVASAPLGDALKAIVKDVPLAAPLVDTFLEATDNIAQDQLTKAAAPIADMAVRKSGDVKAATKAAAARIIANVDIAKAARKFAAAATGQATIWSRKTSIAKHIVNQADRKAVDNAIRKLTDTNKGAQSIAVDRVADDPSTSRQAAIVDRLRSIRDTGGGSARLEAAHSIFALQPDLPTLISEKEGAAAGDICGCRWVTIPGSGY